MSLLGAAELSLAPWIGLGIVGITWLHLNGWLNDELMGELRRPFSRATITAVTVLSVLVGQIYWLGYRF